MQIAEDVRGFMNEQEILLYTITANNGQSISITNLGGIIHSWKCYDKFGHLDDILLGCKDMEGYLKDHPYFNAVIGRVANRIAYGIFVLDGREYQLPVNLPPHCLHGGGLGLDRKLWLTRILHEQDSCSLHMTATISDMEDGIPGNLLVEIIYIYTEDNQLIVHYKASTDLRTLFNPTLHLYLNLGGQDHPDILDHQLWIDADRITESDDTLIPTGNFLNVGGTPLDFRKEEIIGHKMKIDHPLLYNTKGYDHNYVLNNHNINAPVAILSHAHSGRCLSIFTDRPAMQLYTGNWLGDVSGKTGKYRDYNGVCLETQAFPDAPNHKHFTNIILNPEETFESFTSYKVGIM